MADDPIVAFEIDGVEIGRAEARRTGWLARTRVPLSDPEIVRDAKAAMLQDGKATEAELHRASWRIVQR